MRRLLAIAVALGLLSSSALAWGPVGHQTVAYIAEDNLNAKARARVQTILGPDLGLADVSLWADSVRVKLRPETAPWHFIDIEDRSSLTKADAPKFCGARGCVVDQLIAEIQILNDKSSPRPQQLEALKFLVHFMGDVHQPLHCADDHDRGGNEKWVRVSAANSRRGHGRKVKLHAFWDHLLQIKTAEDPRELATALEQRIGPQHRLHWAKGTPWDWAWESHIIAHDVIYTAFEPGPTPRAGVPLPAEYQTPKMRAVVDVQLEKAGIRLAFVLNAALGW